MSQSRRRASRREDGGGPAASQFYRLVYTSPSGSLKLLRLRMLRLPAHVRRQRAYELCRKLQAPLVAWDERVYLQAADLTSTYAVYSEKS